MLHRKSWCCAGRPACVRLYGKCLAKKKKKEKASYAMMFFMDIRTVQSVHSVGSHTRSLAIQSIPFAAFMCCLLVVQKTSSNASSTMESPHRRQDWIIVWCCEQQLITHTWAAPWNFYTIKADDGAVCIVWCCSVECKYNVMISSTVDTSPDCNLVLFKQHMYFFILCALCAFFAVFASSTDESTTQLGHSLWIFCAVILHFPALTPSWLDKKKGNSCITSLILFTFIWMRWWNDSSVLPFFFKILPRSLWRKEEFSLFLSMKDSTGGRRLWCCEHSGDEERNIGGGWGEQWIWVS